MLTEMPLRKATPDGERSENCGRSCIWTKVPWLLPSAVVRKHGQGCSGTQGDRDV